MGLKGEDACGACGGSGGEHPEGGDAQGQQGDGHGRDSERPGRYVEGGVEGAGDLACAGGCAMLAPEAHRGVDGEGEGHGGHGGEHHVSDVLEEVYSAGRGCYYGGVAQRRHFVAEVGAGDYGAGYPCFGVAEHGAYAHECHAYGGYRAPGAAGEHRHCATHGACYDQEVGGVDDVEAVDDEGGHHAAEHPGGGHHADAQQHGHCRENLHGAALEAGAQRACRVAVAEAAEQQAQGGCAQQDDRAIGVDEVGTSTGDDAHEHHEKEYDGQQRECRRGTAQGA